MVQNIKIIDLLDALNKEELADFQRYMQSPYFVKGNAKDELFNLLNYITGVYMLSDNHHKEPFDREDAFSFVYPNQLFVDKKIEKALSALHSHLKNFISVHRFSLPQNAINRDIEQLVFLRQRGLHNRYKNFANTLLSDIKNLEAYDIESIKSSFDLNYEIYKYDFQYNIKNSHEKFGTVVEQLEVYYLAAKLELMNLYLTISYFSSVELPKETDLLIKNSLFPEELIKKYPFLHVNYCTIRLMQKKELLVSEVEDAKALLEEYEKIIEKNKYKQILTFLRNVCLLNTLKRRYEFYPLLFQLSKEHYERGYLHYDGKITSSALISISQTALINREFDWCKHFIDEQKDKVLNDTPEQDYYHLALANYYTFKGDFDQALSLVPATMPTPDIHLLAKRIELKCYYEIKSPLLDAKIDAFRMFLSRMSKNTISDQLHQSNSNFLNILNQIHMSIPGDKKRNQKLLERIEEKSYLFEREWLIQKVHER